MSAPDRVAISARKLLRRGGRPHVNRVFPPVRSRGRGQSATSVAIMWPYARVAGEIPDFTAAPDTPLRLAKLGDELVPPNSLHTLSRRPA